MTAGDRTLRAAADLVAALGAAAPEAEAALAALLHPRARFMTLGKQAEGAAAAAREIAQGPNGDLARRLHWQPPLAVGEAVRLVGERQPGTSDRGLVMTLGFDDGGRIVLVQQQRTPPPPPAEAPLVLPAELKAMIDGALVERHPMLLAYVDADGQPVMSFRGSVQADGDDRLAMWIRSPEGAFVRAIRANPRVALVYRNEDSKATYHFQGRARVSDSPADRQRVFARAPQAEQAHDFAMLGVPVLVDLDRVDGYAGLGPAGQVGGIRLRRGATADAAAPSFSNVEQR